MKIVRIFLITVFITAANYVHANLSIVRDAEIEEILTEIVQSIFKVAGLRPESAKVYVIDSNTVNAFTIGNGYIFINSGLLLQFTDPLQLLGILCHETGHIAAGHINRKIIVMQQRSENFLIAMLTGILGTAITGSEKSLALILGYVITDERFYLHFSRGEELAADAMAAVYLEKLGYGADVMIDVFNVFQRINALNDEINLPVYIKSHPNINDRISSLKNRIKSKKYTASLQLSEKYNRVLIKLKAYLQDQGLSTIIPGDDYSRAIYYHKIGKSKEAINLMRKLIANNPNDIYYKETLAQILYESGQLMEAIEIYEKIYSKNINTLIKIDYANILIEANKKVDLAISILETAKYSDYFNSSIFKLLSKGYGKQGKEGLALLMLVQEQILLQDYHTAYKLVINCLKKLNKQTEASQIKKAQYFKELLERKGNFN